MGLFCSFLVLILLASGCHSHSIDKRQAVFQDIVRQRTLGNSIAQCPCVIHPESRQCIAYDSRYQATGPEEAILAFIDLSNGRHSPGIVNSATFACRTAECQHCFALMFYRLQDIGMVAQNFRTVTSVLRRNQVNSNLCPRFKFPLPPVIPIPPVQQPDYIRSMISAGLRFANIASTVTSPLPRQFNNRNRFRPGPRLQDQQPTPVAPQPQRQQRWDPQTRTWVSTTQQQQRQPQQPEQQHQQWNQPQRPQQQWPQQQNQRWPQQNQQWPQQQQPQVQPQQQWMQQPQQQSWNQQPNVNWNQAATAAATAGAIVGSVLDATGRWRQPQPQPQPIPQPQPQPVQPPFNHNNGWGRPDWGNNGNHWGQVTKPWQNGNGGWNGHGGGGSHEVSASGGWGGQIGSEVLGQLPFGKRSKRATPPLIGRRFTIGCTNRGEAALNDDADFLSLCGSCWTWRELPADYFPRILNELSCQDGDFCLSGWGQCKQQFRNVDVLRRVEGRWVPTVITTATCCDCRVKAGTEIHSLVIGDRRRL